MSGAGYTAAMQPARAAALAELIAEIGRQDAAGRTWELAPADLQRLLGLTPEQYYRELYGAQVAGHPLVSLAQADESFSQASILPLVSLLEHLCGAGAESALERAGIFFSREQQAEITAQFLNAAAREVGAHRFRTDEFTAMLRTFGNLSQARRSTSNTSLTWVASAGTPPAAIARDAASPSRGWRCVTPKASCASCSPNTCCARRPSSAP